MAQVVYYVTATDHLRDEVNFCVPSGNFGNVFSGWIAKQMGAPIGRLIIASNANDILTRFFTDNDMSTRPVSPSLSPSMDIQVSSNFERLLFEINGRDGGHDGRAVAAFPVHRSVVDRSRPTRRVRRRSVRRGAARRRRDTRRHSPLLLVDRHADRPAHRGRGRRRGTGAILDLWTDRDDGDRAPGQVSRCCRAGDRNSTGPPGASRGPDGATGVLHESAQRSRRGGGFVEARVRR